MERIQVIVDEGVLPGYPYPLPTSRPGPPRPSSDPYQVPLGGEFQFRCFAESKFAP